MKKALLGILAALLIFTLIGCTPATFTGDVTSGVGTSTGDSSEDVANSIDTTTGYYFEITSSDLFSDRDLAGTYDERESVELTLTNETQTISSGGVYIISGSLENGQIIVDCGDDDKVQLVLDDVSISCDYSAPIYIKNADKVFVTLADGTENYLSVDAELSDNADSVDSVIFSKSDITFNGSGILTINSDYTHGIVGKDDVVFAGGIYNITVSNDGIQANDSVRTIETQINIVSGQDGIQTKNDEDEDKGFIYCESTTLNLDTAEDAISSANYVYIVSGNYEIDSDTDGISADTFVKITGGRFEITTGGGYKTVLNSITLGEGSDNVISVTDKLTESMKAIKSTDIIVEQGAITISSYEDGFNADNNILISDGNIMINAGDEALTAKNTVAISGGTIIVENGYEGIEGKYITISGGEIDINVLDDGLNGNETTSLVTISGGTLSVTCQGDGLDSNGDLMISGGDITLNVSAIYTGGDGNIDVTGTVSYTGGTVTDEDGKPIDPTEQISKVGGRPR